MSLNRRKQPLRDPLEPTTCFLQDQDLRRTCTSRTSRCVLHLSIAPVAQWVASKYPRGSYVGSDLGGHMVWDQYRHRQTNSAGHFRFIYSQLLFSTVGMRYFEGEVQRIGNRTDVPSTPDGDGRTVLMYTTQAPGFTDPILCWPPCDPG